MKYRYLIELGPWQGGGSWGGTYVLTQITPEDTSGKTLATYPAKLGNVQTAKDEAQSFEPHQKLRWSNPPKAWQPDALLVSQWLDDGVKENRDS